MRLLPLALGAFLTVTAFAPGARAAGSDDLARAKAKYSEAARQFDLTEYVAALDGFRESYRLSGDPMLSGSHPE